MKKLALASVMSIAACLGTATVQAAPATDCNVGQYCHKTLIYDIPGTYTMNSFISGHNYVCAFSGQVGPDDKVTMGSYNFSQGIGIYLAGYPNVTNSSQLIVQTTPFPGTGYVTFDLKQKAHALADVTVFCYPVS